MIDHDTPKHLREGFIFLSIDVVDAKVSIEQCGKLWLQRKKIKTCHENIKCSSKWSLFMETGGGQGWRNGGGGSILQGQGATPYGPPLNLPQCQQNWEIINGYYIRDAPLKATNRDKLLCLVPWVVALIVSLPGHIFLMQRPLNRLIAKARQSGWNLHWEPLSATPLLEKDIATSSIDRNM